jgi:urease accessory protein UreE
VKAIAPAPIRDMDVTELNATCHAVLAVCFQIGNLHGTLFCSDTKIVTTALVRD